MPFKSEAQRRYFHVLENRGEMPHSTVEKWERHTPNKKKLPMHAKKAMTDLGSISEILADPGRAFNSVFSGDYQPKLPAMPSHTMPVVLAGTGALGIPFLLDKLFPRKKPQGKAQVVKEAGMSQFRKAGAFERIFLKASPSDSPEELANRMTAFTEAYAPAEKTASGEQADITDERVEKAMSKRASELSFGEKFIYRFASSDNFAQS